jgi:hypothetical protein
LVRESLTRAVTVSPDVLAKYVGTYDIRFPETPTVPQYLRLRLVDGQLAVDDGPPVTAFSETTFSAGGGLFEVVRDERGFAIYLLFRASEGEIKATRVSDPN